MTEKPDTLQSSITFNISVNKISLNNTDISCLETIMLGIFQAITREIPYCNITLQDEGNLLISCIHKGTN